MSVYNADHRARIWRIMRDQRFDNRGRELNAWNYVLTNELQAGSQFVLAQPGGQQYLVVGGDNGSTNEVIQVSSRGGTSWLGYLNNIYGLIADEKLTGLIHQMTRAYIQRIGVKAEVRRFAAYDRASNTGYLSAYDGRMYRIDGTEVVSVANGEDQIFFADDDGGVALREQPEIGAHGILFDRLTAPNFASAGLGGMTADQQKKALTIWMFALAFPDLIPHKPILMLEGAFGSGKTSCATLIQAALMGSWEPMVLQRNKEDDFGVVLLRSPIALFDNTDSYIDWVPDAIAAYTTGGKWKKRKLFTDEDQLVIKPHAFVVIATRNPASFRRDDVADRCVILRFERWKTFTRSEELHQNVIDERPQLLGEYLFYLNQIIARIRADGGMSHQAEQFRMSDFAAFGRVVGRVLGWPDDEVSATLASLQNERDAFINEDDPLIDLLQRWCGYKSKFAPSNIGRLITAPVLHSELETFAQAASLQWKDSPRTLAQKLRSTHIEREFRVEIMTIQAQKHYRIWRSTDPRLELVPSDLDPEGTNEPDLSEP